MLHVLDKAKAADRTRVERLLSQSARTIRNHFVANVNTASSPDTIRRHIAPLLSQGRLQQAVELIVNFHAGQFANSLGAVFVDAASAEMAHLSRKLTHKAAKAPTVSLAFNVTDPRAVRLMEANRLRQVTGLTRAQTTRVRDALVRATRESLGTAP